MKTDKKPIHKATLPQYANAMYLRLKLAWVEWMDRQSTRLGRRGQYIALVLFVSISLSCCLLLIFGGTSKVINAAITQLPITKVKTVNQTPIGPHTNDSVLQNRIQSFHKYIDSLARSPSGRKTRDSLLVARPGLMDSVRIAESLINNRKTSTYEKQ
jgi:hypothetical protein